MTNEERVHLPKGERLVCWESFGGVSYARLPTLEYRARNLAVGESSSIASGDLSGPDVAQLGDSRDSVWSVLVRSE